MITLTCYPLVVILPPDHLDTTGIAKAGRGGWVRVWEHELIESRKVVAKMRRVWERELADEDWKAVCRLNSYFKTTPPKKSSEPNKRHRGNQNNCVNGLSKREKGKPIREKRSKNKKEIQAHMPSAEEVAQKLGKANSIGDFYGKDAIFAKLLSRTLWREAG